MKRIYFTVTNDLNYDQRMHRICGSLVHAGYDVTLVGRKLKTSSRLPKKSYHQKRLSCVFNRGFLFYAEYNIRLFLFLLSRKMDAVCAIDLDTLLPCLFVSRFKGIHRVYDAHEYFTELKEVRTRPVVRRIWKIVEGFGVRQFKYGYTVSGGLAELFHQKYKREYAVVRNLPVLQELVPCEREKFILFQGAVNEARGFEYLIPAMRKIKYNLVICGDGNFMEQLKKLIRKYRVKDKVELLGMVAPDRLRPIAQKATLGIGLAEKEGANQFFALPNKFFEYMHAGLPQITMAYPEYKRINDQYKIAVLLDDLIPETIANRVNEVMEDHHLLQELEENCMKARPVFCWQQEEQILIEFYRKIFKA